MLSIYGAGVLDIVEPNVISEKEDERGVVLARKLYECAWFGVAVLGVTGFLACYRAHGLISLLGLLAFPLIVYVPIPGMQNQRIVPRLSIAKLVDSGFTVNRAEKRVYWVRSISVAALGGSIASAFWALAFAKPGAEATGTNVLLFALFTLIEIGFAWFFLFFGFARGLGK